ncbi:MAG: lysine 2,3-aminomutase [Chloroflexi bacterium]|nr:lysine 2,3-aminomutase [Chloroflexota bacterium]
MTIHHSSPSRHSDHTAHRGDGGLSLQQHAEEPYETLNLHNFEQVPQLARLPKELRDEIKVVGHVLPFKSNRYVVDHLIDWDNVPDDPMYRLTFPKREMLTPEAYARIEELVHRDAPNDEVEAAANEIRLTLNPHPAGQLDHNAPLLDGKRLPGMQHKYRETVLFFPSQGQTCHAYCTFCFRWPQFVGLEGMKFAMREATLLREYVHAHPDVSDILFTGGDPLIMKTRVLRRYVAPLLEPGAAPNIATIRIGSKALAYWPHRFVSDDDAEDLLALFREVVDSGRQLSFMAHFSHPAELETPIVREAIRLVRETGAQIRTQTPVLRHINADAPTLARMWRLQTQLGCIPYYLFVERDTGARRYFELPLVKCWEIFRDAYAAVGGNSRTVRGPSMSATPGKVQVLGVTEVAGERVIALRMLQGRNPDWVGRPFFARYSDTATWLDGLEPAFGASEFFYDAELREMLSVAGSPWSRDELSLPMANTS